MHNPRMPPRSLALVAGIAVLGALAGTGCGGSVDDRPARWSFIAATIVEPGCATVSCHSAISQRGGVDLHAREIGYYTLINGFYVIPKLPDQSTVVTLLNAEGSLRMPPDVPLPQADIALIETWITDGAPNN
jgi:Planctomycete cytochrome C